MDPRLIAECRRKRRRLLAWALVATAVSACGERAASSGATNEDGTTASNALQPVVTYVETTETGSTSVTPLVADVATVPVGDAPSTTRSEPSATGLPATATLPPPVPATEHQLAVLAAAFSMPGRPDLHDIAFGQEVTVGNRTLIVNVPIFGAWQYNDLDAQGLPGASSEETEAATRDLLTKLGIDTTGLTAKLTPNGPGTDVELAGCIVRFASDGRVEFAAGLLEDIA